MPMSTSPLVSVSKTVGFMFVLSAKAIGIGKYYHLLEGISYINELKFQIDRFIHSFILVWVSCNQGSTALIPSSFLMFFSFSCYFLFPFFEIRIDELHQFLLSINGLSIHQ